MKFLVITLMVGAALGAAINDGDCPEFCFAVFSPVCGSDGVTYGNDCKRDIASCKAQKLGQGEITLVSRGNCKIVDEACPEVCDAVYLPVCGSDGRTYSNGCTLGIASCESKKGGKGEITAVSKGECNSAVETKCPEVCFDLWAPVCGSDGKSYGNDCELSVASCKSKQSGGKQITIVSKGECKKVVEESCPLFCTMEYRPVCGSDGKTYGNPCGLNVASCLSKKRGDGEITKVIDGECKKAVRMAEEAEEDKCPAGCTKIYSPVCGSDGKTYGNECMLKMASCQSVSDGEKEITKISEGRCRPVVCPQFCMEVYAPVCGSNGFTYSNTCKLAVASCHSVNSGQGTITAAKHGSCEA